MIRVKHFAFLLVAFSLASFLWWHKTDSRPSSMDETRHMKLALDYKAAFTEAVPLTNSWSHVYPPLFHFSMIPALSVGVPSEMKAASVNLIYLCVLIAGLLLLSMKQQRQGWEGVAAAFLCVSYISVFWGERRALIDFALMCWVTLSISLLAATEGFTRRRASLAWGVSAGIGMLLKPPFAFFLLCPTVWTLCKPDTPSGKLKNFASALGLLVLIGLPWYLWQNVYFFDKASRLAGEITGPGTDPRTLSGWLFYGRLLPRQMGLASLLFTGAGVFLALIRRPFKAIALLVVWFVGGYVILSLLMNKDPRHTLALLPPLALLAIQGWSSVWPFAWGPAAMSIAAVLLCVYNQLAFDRPDIENWKHGEILNYMREHHDPTLPMITASILSHHPRFFARTIKWSAIQRGIEMETISPGNADASFSEFIVVRPGDQGSETALLDKQWQALNPETRAFTGVFQDALQVQLPTGNSAQVYQRQAHVRYDVSPLTTSELEKRVAAALSPMIQGALTVTAKATPEGLAEGRLTRLKVSCGPCRIKGLRLQKADLTLENPRLNLYRLWDEKRLGLLGFEVLRPVLLLAAPDLVERLSTEKHLANVRVQFTASQARIEAQYKNEPIQAVAQVQLQPSGKYPTLNAQLKSVSFRNIPLPGWLIGKARTQSLPLYPVATFPGRIQIDSVQLENDVLKIN